jgi:adenylate kinase
MLNIVLFGPPGAGKGTQSEKLLAKYGLIHLSTGDILRTEIKAGTQLGIQAKELMDKGNLVPDSIIIGMIDSKISNNPQANGFIFDGFPRTEVQAAALDELLQNKGTGITLMLSLQVEEKELITRLLERGKTSGRADDQNEEIIANRIKVYNYQTSVLVNYYAKQNKHLGINGIGAIETIFDHLCSAIDQAAKTL